MLCFSPLWITLGPVLVINTILLTSFFSYHIYFKRKKREYVGAKNQGSIFLGTTTREWWFWTTEPIVRFFVKFRIGPNLITMIGVAISFLAALLFAYGWFGYAGWVMVFGASFDMFDGRVARITGRSSRSGAFFDSVTDRFSEGMCFLGLAVYFRDSWILLFVILALIGSMLVSYTRARGECFGINCSVGWMQRPERIVYIGVSAILEPMVTLALKAYFENPIPILLIAAIIFIAIMTNVTAVYRIVYVMNALDSADKRDKESFPQIIAKFTTPEGREEIMERAKYGYERNKGAYSHAVLFHAGALSLPVMKEMMDRGELPNISKHIAGRGGIYDAVSAFPSSPVVASAPFVTGSFPGSCDVPGNRWFDRRVPEGRVISMMRFRDYFGWGAYALDHDLSKSVRTIFEYSRQAVNIFGALNRGCGLVRDPAFFRLRDSFQSAMGFANLKESAESAAKWFKQAMKRETDLVFYSFPPLAFFGALEGEGAEQRKVYAQLDEHIGNAAEVLSELGIYDQTAMVLSADCALCPLEKKFDLEAFLGRRFKVFSNQSALGAWHDSEVISLVTGTSCAHLYLRANGGWDQSSFFEDGERLGIVGSLLERDEIDLVAGRSVEGGVVVQSSRGKARILEDADGRLTYLVKGQDPFGFSGIPQILDASQSLENTASTKYPDGVLQMAQMFRSRRTGDVVVASKAYAGLESDKSRVFAAATCGSIDRSHSVVPVFSSVPIGVPIMRTADVFATVIGLLGIEPAHKMDGVARG